MLAACSNLKSLRSKRSLSAATLAHASGVSRQTIYAIENGSFVPNTVVALKLARCLSVSVEDLFSLPPEETPPRVRAQRIVVDGRPSRSRQLVRLVNGPHGKLAIPASAEFNFLPRADGFGTNQSIAAFPNPAQINDSQILLAGCDPALSLLAEMAARQGIHLVLIPASSQRALQLLAENKVHIAGSHLPGLAKRSARSVTFASWPSGLISTPKAGKRIRSVTDLASPRITFVNRDKGSGSRACFDSALKDAKLPPSRIRGYNRIAFGHLAAAHSVANGWADCCFANLSAARCYGLPFEPLQTERFDLSIPRPLIETASAQALLNVLASASFRNALAAVAGYDTSATAAEA